MATSSEIVASSSIMATSSVMTVSSVMATSSASRDYAMHSIMNVSVSFPFWHKFAVVNDGFFGMQKRALQKTRSEACHLLKRSGKPFSVTKNRSQPQICAKITKIGTRFRRNRNAIFEKPARHPLPMHAWSDAAKSARSKRKWRTPKIIGSPD